MDDGQEPGACVATRCIERRGAPPDAQICVLYRLLRRPGIAEDPVSEAIAHPTMTVIQRQQRRLIAAGNVRNELVVSRSQVDHRTCLLDHTRWRIGPDHPCSASRTRRATVVVSSAVSPCGLIDSRPCSAYDWSTAIAGSPPSSRLTRS